MMLCLGGPYRPSSRMSSKWVDDSGARRKGFVARDAVGGPTGSRPLARRAGRRLLAVIFSRRLYGPAGIELDFFCRQCQLQRGRADAAIGNVAKPASVAKFASVAKSASVVGLDNLPLSGPRVDKAIG